MQNQLGSEMNIKINRKNAMSTSFATQLLTQVEKKDPEIKINQSDRSITAYCIHGVCVMSSASADLVAEDKWWISRVFVHPKHRRKHIGKIGRASCRERV